MLSFGHFDLISRPNDALKTISCYILISLQLEIDF